MDPEFDGDNFNSVGKELDTFGAVDGLKFEPDPDPDSVALLVGDGDLSMVVAIIDGLSVRKVLDEPTDGNVVPFCSDGACGI